MLASGRKERKIEETDSFTFLLQHPLRMEIAELSLRWIFISLLSAMALQSFPYLPLSWVFPTLLVIVGGFLFATAHLLWRGLRIRGQMEHLIRRLERRYPELNMDLLTLHEWKEDIHISRLGLSQELYGALEKSLYERIRNLRIEKDFGWTAFAIKNQKALLLSSLLFVHLAIFGQSQRVVERLNEAWNFKKAPHGWLKDASPMRVGNLFVRYEYPKYSELPPSNRKPLETPHLEALRGTKVTLQFEADQNFKSIGLLLPDGEFVPARPKEGFGYEINFSLVQSGPAGFRASDEKGNTYQDSVRYELSALPDELPHVVILKPEKDLEVASNDEILFQYEAEDDFGLEDISIHMEGEGIERKISLPPSTSKQASGVYELDLSLLPISDEVTSLAVYVLARDNDSVSGPKEGRSKTIHLNLKKERQARSERILSLQYFLSALLDILADDLEKQASSWEANTARLKELLKATETLKTKSTLKLGLKLKQEIQSLLEHRSIPFKGENEFSYEIRKLEELILLLDARFTREHLRELSGNVRDATQLADRLLKELESSHGEKSAKELRSMLDAVEQALQEIARSLANLSQKGTPEFVNPEAFNEKGIQSISREMERIRQLLAQGKLEEARQALKRELERLKNLAKEMDSSSKKRSSAGEELKLKLKALRESQRKLMDETVRLSEKEKEKSRKLGEEQATLKKNAQKLFLTLGPENSKGDEVAEKMESASEKLKSGTPTLAPSDQRDAIALMEEFEREMQQTQDELQEEGSPVQEQMGGVKSEPVMLPDAARSKETEEWRRKLLEGMKQKPPAGFEDATRKYFEELLK